LDEAFVDLYQRLNQVPVLILDQFEELFIFHSTSENFIDNVGILLDTLLGHSFPIKIFLFIRSDYFGHLVHLERYFPKVFYPKVLVDMPGRNTLEIIIGQLFDEFKIATESEDKSEIGIILNNICVKRGDELFEHSDLYFLPYLQIYLDALYQRVFKRTYKGEQFNNEELKEITITEGDVHRLGSINRVLMQIIRKVNVSILEDSKVLKNKKIKNRIQEVKLPATILLKRLVSAKNTKKRIYFLEGKFSSKDLEYLLGGFLFDKISIEDQQSILEIMLDELENNRLIIRNNKEQYLELVHDSLAEFISAIVVDKDEQGLLAQKFVADYELHKSYEEDEEDFFLDRDVQKKIGDKKQLEKYLAALDIELVDEYKTFWSQSYWHNKAKQRRAKWIRIFVFSSLLIGLFVSFYFLLDAHVANQKVKTANSNALIDVKKNRLESDVFRSVGNAYGSGKSDLKNAFGTLKIDTAAMIEIARDKSKDKFSRWEILKSKIQFWKKETSVEIPEKELLRRVRDSLEFNDKFEIRRQYFRELENNIYKRPFYLNSIKLRNHGHEEMILSTKTRKLIGTRDTFIIYAQTPDHLHQYTYDLENDTVYHDEEFHGKISSFEPFAAGNKSQVLVSSAKELILLNETLLEEKESCEVGHNFILIEKLNGGNFLCLKDDKKSIFKYNLNNNHIAPYSLASRLNFKIREIFKISYLESTGDIIIGLKSTLNKDWIVKIDGSDIIGGVSFQNLISIKNIKVQKNGRVYIADASSVYKFESSEITNEFENKQSPPPIIIHDDDTNGEIKTIDIERNKFIIGTQGNIAQTYFNDGSDYKSAIKKQKLIGHNDALINVSFVKKGEFAFTSGQGGSIKVWNLEEKALQKTSILSKNNGISLMRYRDNSLFVAYRLVDNISEYGPGFIAEYSDQLSLKEKYFYRGKQNFKEVEMPNFDFEPNGNIAAGTFWGQEIRSAQVAGSMVKSILPEVGAVVIDVRIVDSLMIAATSEGIKVFVKRDNKYIEQELHESLNNDVQINAVDYNKNSKKIIGAGEDGMVYIWDLLNNRLDTLHDHHDKVTDVSFSADGSFFVSCSWDNRAIVWKNIQDPESSQKHIIKVHHSDIEDVAISTDNIIATASSDNTVQLHKVVNTEERFGLIRLPSMINHDFSIRAVTFGESSNILYAGDKKGVIKKWDRNTFKDF